MSIKTQDNERLGSTSPIAIGKVVEEPKEDWSENHFLLVFSFETEEISYMRYSELEDIVPIKIAPLSGENLSSDYAMAVDKIESFASEIQEKYPSLSKGLKIR